MVKIINTGDFDLMYRQLIDEDEAMLLATLVFNKIELFKKNPDDTRLDSHPLTKRMEGKWAFSITDDVRIVYKWLSKTTVRFLAIGGHRKVYKRK